MDKKKVQAIDYFMGLLMGIIGVIFFIAFMGVDAYMFNIQPPPWSRTIENNIFLQPFWLDFLSTIMLEPFLEDYVGQNNHQDNYQIMCR